MNKKSPESELKLLRKRVSELEKIKNQQTQIESELKSLNQQLDASNQQLQASEQQLKASEQQLKSYNAQLEASEKELKKKEIAARQAREFAENIIDTVRHPLLVLNKNLEALSANRYFYKLFEVDEKETIGQKLNNLGNNQWKIPKLQKLLKEILPEKSTIEDFEVSHNFEDIGHRIMLLNARELIQEAGKERLILLAIEDVTKEKEAEEQLKRLNIELERKAEDLQQILYVTTHDLRSPLVNIQGFTREMQSSLKELKSLIEKAQFNSNDSDLLKIIMDEEIPEAIHFITSSTNKMDNLLTGLLALSRLGRQKLTFHTLDMNKLMDEVLDNYKFEIDKNNINIECGNLPPCRGDELQINQLFSNLIGNSIKFLDPDEPGKISINGKAGKKESVYTIEDNGIGISKEYHKKIFGLFEKLDSKKEGIGLGMNIVQQIVERHNGSIKMESALGKGTRFIIFIPV